MTCCVIQQATRGIANALKSFPISIYNSNLPKDFHLLRAHNFLQQPFSFFMPSFSSTSSVHISTRRSSNGSSRGSQQPVPDNGGGPMKPSSNGSVATKREKVVRYRECRKNHAANIGGYAVDGCREFMASGEEGTSAALRCAACNCHRSFHKREVESEAVQVCDCSSNSNSSDRRN